MADLNLGNLSTPIEFDNVHASAASKMLRAVSEEIPGHGIEAIHQIPLRVEMAKAHASLALAQEVRELREMLKGALGG